MNAESQHKVEAQNRRKRMFDVNVMISKLAAKSNELAYNPKDGKVNTESIKVAFENEGLNFTDAEIKKIVKRGMLTKPELFMKKKEGEEKKWKKSMQKI